MVGTHSNVEKILNFYYRFFFFFFANETKLLKNGNSAARIKIFEVTQIQINSNLIVNIFNL